MKIKPGLIITNEDPKKYVEVATWCNENNCSLDPIKENDNQWKFKVVENPKPTLDILKEQKHNENSTRCETARTEQKVTVEINKTKLHFISDRKTQSDLQTALMSVGYRNEISMG